jgi:hypothetical protein
MLAVLLKFPGITPNAGSDWLDEVPEPEPDDEPPPPSPSRTEMVLDVPEFDNAEETDSADETSEALSAFRRLIDESLFLRYFVFIALS